MKATKLDVVLETSLLLHHDFHVVTLLHRHTYLPSTSMKGKNNVAVIEMRIRTHFEEFDLNIFLSPPRLYRLHRSRCWFCVMWHHSVFDWSLSLSILSPLWSGWMWRHSDVVCRCWLSHPSWTNFVLYSGEDLRVFPCMPEKEYHWHNDGIFNGRCKEKHENKIVRFQINKQRLVACLSHEK